MKRVIISVLFILMTSIFILTMSHGMVSHAETMQKIAIENGNIFSNLAKNESEVLNYYMVVVKHVTVDVLIYIAVTFMVLLVTSKLFDFIARPRMDEYTRKKMLEARYGKN